MPEEDRLLVEARLRVVEEVLVDLLSGEMQRAMNELHATAEDADTKEPPNQEEKE